MTDLAAPLSRRRLARSDRAQQLLDTAEEVFAERGFQAASMEEIAERAGITKPILYDHFGSKDRLFAAVLERGGERLREELAAALQDARPGKDALQRGLLAYFRFIEERAPSWSSLLTEIASSSAAAQTLEAIRAERAAHLTALIAAEAPQASAATLEIIAQAIIGASERLAMQRERTPGLDAQTVARGLMQLLWSGLAGLQQATG